mmetsp:Transcript_8590/g.32165  ORF Transcript_8590/g.32165 Transcript_8590/m.32165 type:complete len:203 (+) Transcript_8590:5528-6136(+)
MGLGRFRGCARRVRGENDAAHGVIRFQNQASKRLFRAHGYVSSRSGCVTKRRQLCFVSVRSFEPRRRRRCDGPETGRPPAGARPEDGESFESNLTPGFEIVPARVRGGARGAGPVSVVFVFISATLRRSAFLGPACRVRCGGCRRRGGFRRGADRRARGGQSGGAMRRRVERYRACEKRNRKGTPGNTCFCVPVFREYPDGL